MANAADLFDALVIQLKVEEPRHTYMHGWGERCADANLVVFSWLLTIMDTNGPPTTLIFDLVRGESPLIIGMDVKQYSDTYNRTPQKSITYRRPGDVRPYTFHTYIQRDGGGNKRLRMLISPHKHTTFETMMANITSWRERNLPKRVHRLGQASGKDMKDIMSSAVMDAERVSTACDTVYTSCAIFAATGSPANKKKLSTAHVNESFNE